jgi:hypothetical protein
MTARVIAAFVLAPLIVAAAIAFLVLVATATGDAGGLQAALHIALIAFVSAGGIGLVLALVLGVPTYLASTRLRIVSPWATTAAAALIGASFPWLAHFLLLDPSASLSANGCRSVLNGVTTACGYRQLALDMIVPALIGAGGGLAFWLVYNGGWHIKERRRL